MTNAEKGLMLVKLEGNEKKEDIFRQFYLGLILRVNWIISTKRVRSHRYGSFIVKRGDKPHGHKRMRNSILIIHMK